MLEKSRKEYQKKYYLEHKEELTKKKKKYYIDNKEKYKEKPENYRKKEKRRKEKYIRFLFYLNQDVVNIFKEKLNKENLTINQFFRNKIDLTLSSNLKLEEYNYIEKESKFNLQDKLISFRVDIRKGTEFKKILKNHNIAISSWCREQVINYIT